jgi:hypothetical protein
VKELHSVACNFSALPQEEGGFRPLIEAILIVSEPKYSIDEAGDQFKRRSIDALRFTTSPAGLRLLAKNFIEWADEAEQLVAKAIEAAVDSEVA